MSIGSSGVGGPRPTGPGWDQIALVLDIIGNAETYNARIAEFAQRKADAEAAEERLGLAGNIPDLLAKTEADRDEAARLVAEAQKTAEDIVGKARNDANDIRGDARKQNRQERDQLDEFKTTLDRRAGEIELRLQGLSEREAAVSKREKIAEDTMTQAVSMRDDFQERLRKMSEISR